MTDPGPDGFSVFQRRTEAAIREVLAEREIEFERGEVSTPEDADNHIIFKIPGLSLTLCIYRDQVNAESPSGEMRLEEWDAKTPDEHRA